MSARNSAHEITDPRAGADLLCRYLCESVGELIGFDARDVDPDAGLNELGVDSLMAARLRTRVRTEWNLDIPLVTLMQNPSVRGLVRALHEHASTDPGAAVVEGVI